MADEISPLNLVAGEPRTPPELDVQTAKAKEDIYGLNQGKLLYEQQIEKLMSALDARRNMPFDPMWMRIASGFLKPTKTGSFFESLGSAAEGAAEEAEKEATRKTDVEKLKMELAAKQYGLARQNAAMRMLGDFTQPTAGGQAMETTETPAGAPSTGAAPADNMSTSQVVDMVKKEPNVLNEITLTPTRVAAIAATDEALGKVAETMYKNQVEAVKMKMDRYVSNAQGDVFDKATGTWKEKGTRTVEMPSPYDPDVKINMLSSDAEDYKKIRGKDPATINKWLRENGYGAFAIGAETTAPTEGGEATPTGGKTKLERETSAKIKEARAQSDIKANTEQIDSITNKGNAAGDIINNATAVYRYVNDPATAGAFGVFAKKGVMPAILGMAEEGVRVGPYNVGIGGIQDAYRKIKGTQEEVDAAAAAARNLSQLELGFSAALKGQGQVSDNERRIVAAVGPKISDSPKVISLKSESIIARGKFDEKNAENYVRWEKSHPGAYVREYMQTPEYKTLQKQYNEKLGSILTKYGYK